MLFRKITIIDVIDEIYELVNATFENFKSIFFPIFFFSLELLKCSFLHYIYLIWCSIT